MVAAVAEDQRIAVYIYNEEHIYHIQGQICAYIYTYIYKL